MPIANDKFRLESDGSKMAAGGTYSQFQQGQWVIIGCYLKNVPQAVKDYGIK